VDYKPLPGLEALTGADVMVSPDNMPFPRNDQLILSHIKGGAKLIQIKFGHDLPGSIIDGRLNEALSRMLRVTDQRTWQCLLLFVGLLGYDSSKGMATINGQLSYGGHHMKWSQIDQAINFWMYRGGIYYNLPSGKLIPEHLSNTQKCLDMFSLSEDTKTIWPKAPVFYDEIEPNNPHLKKWKVAQKIVVVDDLRSLLCSIPNARIGPGKATAIWEYMAANGYRQDWNGFLDLIRHDEILNVAGIGKKLATDIRWGLFATKEERDKRNEK
jgi:hypothetical protein